MEEMKEEKNMRDAEEANDECALQCWVPAHFTGTWESYSESYCFVENTYYVAMTERFPTTVTDREKRQLHYYQWVPFILAAQLLLFFLPKMMWHTFNWKTGEWKCTRACVCECCACCMCERTSYVRGIDFNEYRKPEIDRQKSPDIGKNSGKTGFLS